MSFNSKDGAIDRLLDPESQFRKNLVSIPKMVRLIEPVEEVYFFHFMRFNSKDGAIDS